MEKEHTPPAHTPHSASHTHAGEKDHSHAHSSTPQKAPSPHSALFIQGIVVLVILIIGALAYLQFNTPPSNTPPAPASVEIKLLLDTQCEYCPQTNTILHKFAESHIQYHVEAIDIYSEEGRALIEEFDVTYAPTALVNVIGLDQNSTIQAALQGQFIEDPLKVRKGWVIVPEKFLDKQTKLLTFVQPPTTCEVPEGKISIRAHMDYGDCKPCIEAYLILEELQSKYSNVEVEYVPIMYGRTTLKAINDALASNKGAVCADKLGYLDPYTSCNYFNAQFHGNLDLNYMKSCILEAGAGSNTTNNQFIPCVTDENSGADQTLISNSRNSYEWNPIGYTPSFVVDCKYSFVGQKSIEPYLCYFHPELEGCTELLEEIETTQSASEDANASASI